MHLELNWKSRRKKVVIPVEYTGHDSLEEFDQMSLYNAGFSSDFLNRVSIHVVENPEEFVEHVLVIGDYFLFLTSQPMVCCIKDETFGRYLKQTETNNWKTEGF